MSFWQDHPRLATAVALAIGAGTVMFLYVLSTLGGPANRAGTTTAGSVTQSSGAGGPTGLGGAGAPAGAAIQQVDFSRALAPPQP